MITRGIYWQLLSRLRKNFLAARLSLRRFDQDIQDTTTLIHRPPEIVACAMNRQEDLI
jgi:hypothetical protein